MTSDPMTVEECLQKIVIVIRHGIEKVNNQHWMSFFNWFKVWLYYHFLIIIIDIKHINDFITQKIQRE